MSQNPLDSVYRLKIRDVQRLVDDGTQAIAARMSQGGNGTAYLVLKQLGGTLAKQVVDRCEETIEALVLAHANNSDFDCSRITVSIQTRFLDVVLRTLPGAALYASVGGGAEGIARTEMQNQEAIFGARRESLRAAVPDYVDALLVSARPNPQLRHPATEPSFAESPAAKEAASLRLLLPKIKNENVSTFLIEAIVCAERSLFRAAVVLSWVGAMALLHEHVATNHLVEFNAEASRRDPKWKPVKTTDELGRMKEAAFLEILQTLRVVGPNVRQELEVCLKLRNACGHPNSFKLGSNRVAAHLETLALNVYAVFE